MAVRGPPGGAGELGRSSEPVAAALAAGEAGPGEDCMAISLAWLVSTNSAIAYFSFPRVRARVTGN